ncbi:MAG TPA: M1 family peptidase [Candidatus Melainabacteria bacterium]|jgi:puromycin-sensitive aminopeptidase|nr:M1 family peptidase [Candidatus Melainabacteria bacterium]HIN66116.1 M1 family peptidase [Candidatus Obscuribacterales bacterium]
MSTETRPMLDESVSYRLPRSVVPERYDLHLVPNIDEGTFSGTVGISCNVLTDTDELTLNSLDLTIDSAKATDEKSKELSASVKLDADNERLRLSFAKTLKPGRWKFHIEFNGVLNDKLHGFYRSSYTDEAGTKHTLAVTQCEPTDARRIFPCFDEPDFKAIFKISVLVDSDAVALSNSPIESEKEEGAQKTAARLEKTSKGAKAENSSKSAKAKGKKLVAFKETMKMSTYLVALVVGNLEATEPVIVDGCPIRVWTPAGKTKLAVFSEKVASASLSFFNRYYGIKYPGEKLDLVAVPDFMFGAMENLGCVIFRENALLLDEKTAAQQELERVADVVAHELAHMWFGDLATMRWWNGLWLNEAFATFMQMLATDDWQPNWKRWDTFGVSRGAAFSTDGLLSTRPIEFTVRKPEDAEGMFDVLTYEKGASVLRMLEQYLGGENYRLGIAHYLNNHKYSNTETTDLWDAIEEKSGQPVRQMMDSWIFQGGYPLIHASKEEGGQRWLITQHRFFYLPEEKRSHVKQESVSRYHVPIMYTAAFGKDRVSGSILLTGSSTEITLPAAADWLLLNAGGHGFYRCSYSDDDLAALTKNLYKDLSAIERFGLLSDLWASTLNGSTELKSFLRHSYQFKSETDKNVWTVLIGAINYLNQIAGKGQRSSIREYTRELIMPALERIGVQDETAGSKKSAGQDAVKEQLRGMLFATAGTIGEVDELVDAAQALYARYKKSRTSVSPALTAAAISVLAHHGDEEQYKEFVQQHKKSSTPQEEERFMYALAGFRDKELLRQTLEKTLNGEIRTQNAPYVVRSVMFNPWGRELAWKFMKDNWQKMMKIYPEVMIPRMCEGVTALISEDLLQDVQRHFEQNEVKQGHRTVSQHMEKLAVAVYFKTRERQTLERSWLKY